MPDKPQRAVSTVSLESSSMNPNVQFSPTLNADTGDQDGVKMLLTGDGLNVVVGLPNDAIWWEKFNRLVCSYTVEIQKADIMRHIMNEDGK